MKNNKNNDYHSRPIDSILMKVLLTVLSVFGIITIIGIVLRAAFNYVIVGSILLAVGAIPVLIIGILIYCVFCNVR